MAKVPHERTKIGRALLRQQRQVDKWVEANRSIAPPSVLQAAELLSCELYYAAMNGTGSNRAGLLKSINKLFGKSV